MLRDFLDREAVVRACFAEAEDGDRGSRCARSRWKALRGTQANRDHAACIADR